MKHHYLLSLLLIPLLSYSMEKNEFPSGTEAFWRRLRQEAANKKARLRVHPAVREFHGAVSSLYHRFIDGKRRFERAHQEIKDPHLLSDHKKQFQEESTSYAHALEEVIHRTDLHLLKHMSPSAKQRLIYVLHHTDSTPILNNVPRNFHEQILHASTHYGIQDISQWARAYDRWCKTNLEPQRYGTATTQFGNVAMPIVGYLQATDEREFLARLNERRERVGLPHLKTCM